MSPDEEQRVEEVFSAARDLPPLERAALLERVCEGDAELRRQVDSLLAAHEQAGHFLSQTRVMSAADCLSERTGTRIGRYKLLEQIGEGGFGVVWMAEQEEPVRRLVALKIIKLGMDTKEVVARFEAERQALAMMDHPNIARVFDGGATETGRPYFVMELVKGIPITEYSDANQLSTRERLELLMQVCQAVQHAHQKGIIHRDLKPSNILVTVQDDRPVPKVIDFGVAKATQARLTQKTLFTRLQQWLGTPAYMSPEQAGLGSLDVDTRSDIYSLGVLLYELLTGRTPFDTQELLAAGYDAVMRTIREEEPPKPSTRLSTLSMEELVRVAAKRRAEPAKLSRLVRGDLDWIVMKCLEKDRTRRYETADNLARDLERHMRSEPVSAAAPELWYQFIKFVRRHRASLATATGFLLLLAAGSAISTWQALRATHNAAEARRQAARALRSAQEELQQRRRAELLAEESERNLYAADVSLAQQVLEEGNLGRARGLLAAHRPQPGHQDLRGFEWRYLWGLSQGDNFCTLQGHADAVTCLAFSPDGQTLASGSWDRTVRLWSVRSRNCLRRLSLGSRVCSVAFSSEGLLLAVGAEDGAQVWNLVEGRLAFSSKDQQARVAFSPRANLLAIGNGGAWFGGGGSARIVELSRNEKVANFPNSGGRVAWSSDGQSLLLGDWKGAITLRGITVPGIQGTIEYAGDAAVIRLSSDNRTVATVNGWDGSFWLWDVSTGRSRKLTGHTGRVWDAAFSPDGKVLATVSGDHTARLWDIATGTESRRLRGHAFEVMAAAFSPDGQVLATGDKAGQVMLSSTAQKPSGESIEGVVSKPVFSGHGKWMAANTRQMEVSLWDTDTGRLRATFKGEHLVLGFSPDNSSLITASCSSFPSRDARAQLLHIASWALASGANETTIPLERSGAALHSATLSQDGMMLAAGTARGEVTLWQAHTGRIIQRLSGHPGDVAETAFSPDGRRLATAGPARVACIWTLATGQKVTTRIEHQDSIFGLAFSGDGRTLVTGSLDCTIRLWDAQTGEARGILAGHKEGVLDLALSADARTLASASGDRTVKLWDPATLRELVTLKHETRVGRVSFSPDGRCLGSVCDSGVLRFWRAPSLNQPRNGASAPLSSEEQGSPETLLNDILAGTKAVGRAATPETVGGALTETRQPVNEAGTPPEALPTSFPAPESWLRQVMLPRPAAAGPQLIDLTSYYNGSLLKGWFPPSESGTAAEKNLGELPSGLQSFAGVQFDVRGVIQLAGLALNENFRASYPASVKGIRVDQKCRNLYFLHGTSWIAPVGQTIGHYIIRYSDNTSQDIPLVYGQHVANWWYDPAGDTPAVSGVVAWTGKNDAARAQGKALRLYKLTWANPRPDMLISGIDLVSENSNSSPFLIAVSAEP